MKRIIKVLAVCVMTGVWFSPALAQDGGTPPAPPAPPTAPSPMQVVERCVERLRTLTMTSVEGLARTTQAAVGAIGRMDEAGAPDGVILRAGAAARTRITAISTRGARAINREAEACLRLLRALHAPEPAFEAIRNARGMALEQLRAATERSLNAIREAVMVALEGAPAPLGAGSESAIGIE